MNCNWIDVACTKDSANHAMVSIPWIITLPQINCNLFIELMLSRVCVIDFLCVLFFPFFLARNETCITHNSHTSNQTKPNHAKMHFLLKPNEPVNCRNGSFKCPFRFSFFLHRRDNFHASPCPTFHDGLKTFTKY